MDRRAMFMVSYFIFPFPSRPILSFIQTASHTLKKHPDNDSDFGSSTTSSYLFDSTGRQVTPSVHAGQEVEKGNASYINHHRVKKIEREQKRKDAILGYWNIENFEHQPLKLDARKSTGGLSKEALGRFLRAQRELESDYGAELAKVAKLNEGMGEEGKKRVYSHDMPEELRRKLEV